ncbi:TatD family hydrolase [Psychromonas hadalis]|uniref:TatD family hydrolase n=1 Tax=Psychromonas hadalis TaxID=211669 RepID=UPI0003B46E00|nr:TatD family hydrolase [Psychromonas hadalis]
MFIDSHCHLDFACFSDQFDSLLTQLNQQQITKLVIPATQASGWSAIMQLANSHSALYYALGLHPHFLENFQVQNLTQLHSQLSICDKKCIALGEIGLDKFAPASFVQQEFVFVEQLKIAQQLKLPIILHCVKKQNRVLELLKQQFFTQGGVYHAFSGSLEMAHAFIKLGFKLGIGGVITYPNSTKTRETVANLPIESILLETDAPDMPLYNQSTKINTPLNILPIFNCLAELRKESKSLLAKQLYENSCSIFSLNND